MPYQLGLQNHEGESRQGKKCVCCEQNPVLPAWAGRRGKMRRPTAEKQQCTHNWQVASGIRVCNSILPSGMESLRSSPRILANFQNPSRSTHLSPREYEHESRPCSSHAPGEEGSQQGLEHRAVALEHTGYSWNQKEIGSAMGGLFQWHTHTLTSSSTFHPSWPVSGSVEPTSQHQGSMAGTSLPPFQHSSTSQHTGIYPWFLHPGPPRYGKSTKSQSRGMGHWEDASEAQERGYNIGKWFQRETAQRTGTILPGEKAHRRV